MTQPITTVNTRWRGKEVPIEVTITRITLRPRIVFSGERRPTAEELADLHHRSHEHCYVANSIRAEVHVEAA